MRCGEKDVEMLNWLATKEQPYRYTFSGMSNVFLTGINVYNCPDCDLQLPVIPKIEQLHDVIAREIANKRGLLTGEEVRFLRKNAGYSAAKFATLLTIDPSYLSRVENGHTDHLGAAVDRLARAIALVSRGKDGETARDILLGLAEDLEKGPGKPPPRTGRQAAGPRTPLFTNDKRKGWLRAA
jgi:transcriptional regulator with XRE-family HTH domain